MTDSCYLPRGAHSVSTCGGSSGGGAGRGEETDAQRGSYDAIRKVLIRANIY